MFLLQNKLYAYHFVYIEYSEVIRVVCCDHDLIQRMFADEDLRVETSYYQYFMLLLLNNTSGLYRI